MFGLSAVIHTVDCIKMQAEQCMSEGARDVCARLLRELVLKEQTEGFSAEVKGGKGWKNFY